jgi:hypothetical protein
MLPGHLIVEYWAEVRRRLLEDRKLPDETARCYIAEYQRRLASHGVGDMIYHTDPEDSAAAIADAIEHGFREPVERD